MDQYKPTISGKAPFGEYETAYQVYGTLPTPSSPLPNNRVPLIVLHGGPGVPGRYLLPLSALWEKYGIPVVFYDQIGSGESSHLREKGAEFWTIDLFLDELENLLRYLKIEAFDIIGHSWGTMLAAEFALRRKPQGLRKLVFTNGLADMKMWEDNANALVKQLPKEVQETIERHEKAGDYESEEYRAAAGAFYQSFICRMQPWPEELLASFGEMEKDPTVYSVMLGPSEFSITGTLRTWSIIPHLPQITHPVLVLNGANDEASDPVVRPFVEHVPNAKWVRFEGSAHMPMLEERERYLGVVGGWLAEGRVPEGARGKEDL